MDDSKTFSDFLTHVKSKDKVDWTRVRIQAAIEMMKTLRSDKDYKIFSHIQIARISVEYADALVKELKGE